MVRMYGLCTLLLLALACSKGGGKFAGRASSQIAETKPDEADQKAIETPADTELPEPRDPVTMQLTLNGEDSAKVQEGETVTVKWSSTNADDCYFSPGEWTGLSGEETSSPISSQTEFTLYCVQGSTLESMSATVYVAEKARVEVTINEEAEAEVTYGESVVLAWSSSATEGCQLHTMLDSGASDTATVETSGEKTIEAMSSVHYTLACQEMETGDEVTAQASLVVDVPESVLNLSVQTDDGDMESDDGKLHLNAGQSFVATIEAQNVTDCTVDIPGADSVTLDMESGGPYEVAHEATEAGFVAVNCKDVTGSPISASVDVVFTSHPTLELKVNDKAAAQVTVEWNTRPIISWVAEHADQCTTNFDAEVSLPDGSFKLPKLKKTQSYKVTCENSAGTVEKTITAKMKDSRIHDKSVGKLNLTFHPIDVVFLVDTSGSMDHEADEVNKNLKHLVKAFTKEHAGSKVAIRVVQKGFKPDNEIKDSGMVLHMKDGSDEYKVGSTDALEKFLTIYDDENKHFRKNATKELVVITDDRSNISANNFWKQISDASDLAKDSDISKDRAEKLVLELKDKVRVNAIAWTRKENTSGVPDWCTRGGPDKGDKDYVKDPAEVYRKLAGDDRTKGKIYDLCSEDWSKLMADLGKDLVSKQSEAEFVLSKKADPSRGFWIDVDGKKMSSSKYSFDATRNAIVFKQGALPAENAEIQLSYYKLP